MKDFVSFYNEARDRDLYFILGAQGSGTNFVCNILRHIFGFSVIQDRSLIFNASVNVNRSKSNGSIRREFQDVYSKFFPTPFARRLQLKHYHHRNEHYQGIKEFLNRVEIKSAEDFGYFFYAYHAFSEGKKYVAIKSDDLWENLPILDKIFQNYKYIFLTRDCRDNVLSIMHKNFGPRSIYYGSHYIKERVRTYHNEVHKHPESTVQVKYEELLVNPLDFIQKFSEISGIQPQENIEKRLEELKIRKTNFEKWKTLMNRNELLICESILHDELNALGYGTENQEFPEISKAQIFRQKIYDASARISQKIKRIYRNFARA